MELKVDMPALAGQNVDPAAFRRVWDRVMPGQAVPAEPSIPPEAALPAEPSQGEQPENPDLPPVPECQTQPPVPECPTQPPVPECSTQPPVPECPTQPPVPECPTQPPVPECPAQPQVPDCQECLGCPPCPECPACPRLSAERTLPEQPDLCLGEASQGDSGQLEGLMTLAREGAAAAQAMARRASGSCAKALSALAGDHRMAFRRLSAAYFLITGKRYSPKCPEARLPSSLSLALRQQFVWEQRWERNNRQAAQDTSDPCLKELYLELAQEGAFHAGTIRSLLEQMA